MLLSNLNLLATAPDGVAKLRELILTLAVQGKLVSQNANDEPASELLKKIRAEKHRLIAEKKIRRLKPLDPIDESETVFVLPRTWEWERLGNLGDWGAGATPSRTNSSYYGGDIPWFKSGELNADFISESEETVTDAALRDCSLRLNQVGDVLIAMYGATIGKTAILSVIATTNQAVCACTPFAGLSNTYLLLLMKALKPYFISIGAGGAQPNISREKVIATVIGLPPLAEQSRIVTRVEELMRLCDALEAKARLETTQHEQLVRTLLSSLTASTTPEELTENWNRVATHFDLLLDRPEAVDALEQTILQLAVRGLLVPQDPQNEPAYMYLQRLCEEAGRDKSKDGKHVQFQTEVEGLPPGWCLASVASVAECLDFMRKPIKKDDRQVSGASVPYYGANGQVGWIEDFLFDEDLVLVVEDETFIGRTKPFSYIVRGKSWVNNHAHVLRPLAGMSADYLNLCLQRYDFIPLTSGTTNRRKLTKAGLLDAQFMVAPLAEQSRIVARVASLRALCADLRQRLTTARTQQALLAEVLVQEVQR